jgi:hypothetical protein
MKIAGYRIISLIIVIAIAGCVNSGLTDQKTNNVSFLNKPSKIVHHNMADTFISNLLARYPQLFNAVVSKKDDLGLQIIYTQIERGKKTKDKIKFTDHTYGLDANKYFYPASTVKLPVAILALQKINELKIAGLNKNTTMITSENGEVLTAVCNDPSAIDGRPTIAHYIKKILLVSDNDAFNRLYEFLGQEYINTSLHRMGYNDVQIIHRLDISLTEDQNRYTNPVTFIDTGGKILYSKPAERSKLVYAQRDTRLGNGYLKGGNLIKEPFDFSKKNRLPLHNLHTIVRSIIFPDYVTKEQQFNLTKEDYDFLRRYMSMMPQESRSPVYSSTEYWDTYVKFLFYGSEPGKANSGIRIFNKVGDAYGFLIDAAYIVDYTNGIELMLSAVIYCNSDGIFNDDKYDYDKVGLPFLKSLGQEVYEYERTRVRKNKTILSPFLINYTD